MFTLVNSLIVMVLQGLLTLGGISAGGDGDSQFVSPLGWATLVLLMVYALGVLLPGLAVTIRRLHDTGRSGWWLLISLIPNVGFIVLLVITLQDGQPGDNKWGPDPKGAALGQGAPAGWQ